MIRKYTVITALLLSLSLLGNTAMADELGDRFDGRLSELNDDILQGKITCGNAIDKLEKEFRDSGIYVGKYACEPNRHGKVQIQLREF